MTESKYVRLTPEKEVQVEGSVVKKEGKSQKRNTKSVVKYGLSLVLGLIAAYFVISIIRIEVRGRSLLRTHEEWRELLKEHPYEHKETDVRSPCPMLNTLANHGFINRSGRDIKSDDLFDALMLMGAPPTVTVGILKFVYTKLKEADPDSPFLSQFGEMKTLDLDRLTVAGVLEHDVSLTRNDLSMEPHTTTSPIAEYVIRMHNLAAFFNKGSEYDGIFTRKNENDARRLRWLESYKYNKHMHLNLFAQFASSTECSLLLDIIGRDGTITLPHLKSFLLKETFPDDWVPRDSTYSLTELAVKPIVCWRGLRKSEVSLDLISQL